MILNFDKNFDVFKFHELGFNVGILPKNIAEEAKTIIKNTVFKNNAFNNNLSNKFPAAASWSQLSYDTLSSIIPSTDVNNEEEIKNIFSLNDFIFKERLRELYCYNNAPLEVKNLSNKIITTEFFNNLKYSFVRSQFKNNNWLRTIKPFTFGLWNGADDLPWHNDTDDYCNMNVLLYFNDEDVWQEEWGGQICFGKEQENGEIYKIHQHFPIDSSFVCINNYNPLMKHKTVPNINSKNRYTFSFKYKFE